MAVADGGVVAEEGMAVITITDIMIRDNLIRDIMKADAGTEDSYSVI